MNKMEKNQERNKKVNGTGTGYVIGIEGNIGIEKVVGGSVGKLELRSCYEGCLKHNPYFAKTCGERKYYEVCPTGKRVMEEIK